MEAGSKVREMIMNSVDKEYLNVRTNDYWLEATRPASIYRKDPDVQKKEKRAAIMY